MIIPNVGESAEKLDLYSLLVGMQKGIAAPGREGKTWPKGGISNRVHSKEPMRLFWIPEVSLLGQPPRKARGEPAANQDLHLRSLVERGGL